MHQLLSNLIYRVRMFHCLGASPKISSIEPFYLAVLSDVR